MFRKSLVLANINILKTKFPCLRRQKKVVNRKPAAKKASAPAKRGKCPTLPQSQVVEEACEKHKQGNPHLPAIGAGRLVLPAAIKSAAAKNALPMLQAGKTPADIQAGSQSSHQWSPGQKLTQGNIGKVKKMLRVNNSTAANTQRLLAGKLGRIRFKANRAAVWWQQDLASSHAARKTKQFLKDNAAPCSP